MAQKNNALKKRIGWFCSYVPEELILAAGFDSFRLQGRAKSFQEVDAYLPSNYCLFLRNVLESGLTHQYRDVDAVIFTNTCDGMRRLYEIWCHFVKTPSAYLLEVPKHRDENGVAFFSSELLRLKKNLEKDFGGSVSDEGLGHAIDLMNDRRLKMTCVFEQQKNNPAPFQGSKLYALAVREGSRPKHITEKEIHGLCRQPAIDQNIIDRNPRLMVIGNEGATPAVFESVENCGGSVVLFDTCRGLGHYSGLVEKGSELVPNLARRYLLNAGCPRMPGYEKRIDRLKSLIDEFAIEAVIFSAVQFCDYSLFETVPVQNALKEIGLPFLCIENDYIWSNADQIQTRIEAFNEMVKG